MIGTRTWKAVLAGGVCALAISSAASAAQHRSFDVPAGDLQVALDTYVRQSGAQLIYLSDDVRGKRTTGVRGSLSADAALDRLLDRSGFAATRDTSGALVVAQVSQPRAGVAPRQEEEAAPSSVTEIIVTGSRLGRTSYNSPTPVNVVGQERAQNLNITSVADALNQIPGFRPFTTPATNSFRASQNIAGRSLDLRGLGSNRTLTLVDGRRTVPSGDDSSFDLNALPSIMVGRSEVVTGGASAAYGADAVAGVVNLILDTDFEGVKAEVSYGVSDYWDARTTYAAAQAGTKFADGRGSFVIGGEYADEGGVGDYNHRDWSAEYHNFIPNPFHSTNPALSNGLPANVASDNVLYVLNPSGIISVVHPLQGMQFDNNGNLYPFQFGQLYNRARPSTLMIGGDPSVQDVYGFNNTPLVVPTKHYSALAHVEYDVTDKLRASAELSFARVIGGPASGAIRADQNGAIRINRDNPYLTAQTAAMMDAAGTTFLPVSRSDTELGGSDYVSRNNTWRAFVGFEGEIGDRWRWDAFYEYGKTSGRLTSKNQRITARWTQAVDAVRAPAGLAGIAQGTIICRSTIANPTNGCVPANVMGPNKISAAAVDWVNVDAWQTRKFVQHNLAANIRGPLFEGWAGEITGAAGLEYRTNSSEGDADEWSIANAFTSVSATVLPKTTQKVTEGYAEVNVPVFKDQPFGKSLEVDGAIRRTHYSLSGNATTWKVGGVWEVNDEYMFRVTRSRDIRAPSPLELNPNTRTLQTSGADPKYGVQYPIPSTTGGNPNLELEKAKTFTAGFVIQPEWLPRFRFSIDYYDIKVDGAIDVISIPVAIQLCRAGTNPEVCRLGPDANGNPDRILQVFATYQNVNKLRARGVEIVSNYSVPFADGDLHFTVNGNIVDTLSTTLPDGSTREFENVTGNSGSITALFGVPKWRADAVVTYERPTWSLTAQFRYIPKGILNKDWVGPQDGGYSPYLTNSVSNNRVADRLYVNLNGRVKVWGDEDRNIEVFGGISNLFDRDPPSNLRLAGNGVYFDPVGRAYKFGIRAAW